MNGADRPSTVSLILDSDCAWLRSPDDELIRFGDGRLHGIEVHKHPDPDHAVHIGVSKRQLGRAFERLDPEFANRIPKWWGGEFFGGNFAALSAFIAGFDRAYHDFVAREEQHGLDLGGIKWLDTDEYMNSMVMNSMDTIDESSFIHRVWTEREGKPDRSHLSAVVLHLLAEKHRGFRALYPYCLNPGSELWTTPMSSFPEFLGEFFGIPRRVRFPELTIRERMKALVKRALHRQ